MFSEEKIAQMAAHLLKLRGGCMSYLKLMKLLYLSDRESISHDCMVSMPHGPVLSRTYDCISGTTEDHKKYGWSHWIKDEADYEVSLRKNPFTRNELDELSDIDIEIMDQIFAQFGSMGRYQIRDYTHDHCSEWSNPHGSSQPIKPEDVFKAVGKTQEEITTLLRHYKTQHQLSNILTNLR